MFKIKLENWPVNMTVQEFETKSNIAIKSQILINSAQKVPARSKALYNSALASYGNMDPYIIYEEEYANKMYYTQGLNYSTAVHSQPTSNWHEKDWAENELEYVNIYKQVFISLTK